jgi:peptide-methionine (R)-S-oxide reductase
MKYFSVIDRRQFLIGLATGVAVIMVSMNKVLAATITKINYSDKEWKKRLTSGEYDVLRKEHTEKSASSPLNLEKRKGIYHCAGCDLPIFMSEKKFESGTGWPSFYDVIAGHVETKKDFKMVWPRTEYHCARCGGHQGHVFKDGPKPTGLRYCNNGIALTFKPA